MKEEREYYDVSKLPAIAYGSRAPLWWGNLLMVAIESTMFALVAATYFYLRLNFATWPPRGTLPPDLFPGTLNLIIITISAVPMYLAGRFAIEGRSAGVVTAMMILCILLGIASIIVRSFEFPAMHCRWDTHAYGSIVWTTLGLHMGHLITGTLEVTVLTVWMVARGLDEKHRLDIHVTTYYWYFIVASWVVLYAILYFGPRVL